MAFTSDWTPRGHRVRVDMRADGWLSIGLQTQTLTSSDGKTPQRIIFQLAALQIPVLVTFSEIHRVVEHWLSFYEDDVLIERADAALAAVLGDVVTLPDPEPGAPAGPQGIVP
jgi:hypothetical protein